MATGGSIMNFDYIIVGAGAAGSVLANGNSQAPTMAVAWIAADLILQDS